MTSRSDEANRPVPLWGKVLIAAVLAGFVWLQGWTLLNPAGIMSKYTFIEGFTKFYPLMTRDPLTAAGLWDLMFLELAMIVILLNGIPRTRAYPLVVAAFLIAMVVFPALGGLGFLLLYWRRLGQFRP